MISARPSGPISAARLAPFSTSSSVALSNSPSASCTSSALVSSQVQGEREGVEDGGHGVSSARGDGRPAATAVNYS
jgi:hypothetical protein